MQLVNRVKSIYRKLSHQICLSYKFIQVKYDTPPKYRVIRTFFCFLCQNEVPPKTNNSKINNETLYYKPEYTRINYRSQYRSGDLFRFMDHKKMRKPHSPRREQTRLLTSKIGRESAAALSSCSAMRTSM